MHHLWLSAVSWENLVYLHSDGRYTERRFRLQTTSQIVPKFFQTINKNLFITDHLWGESTVNMQIPRTKGDFYEKCFRVFI